MADKNEIQPFSGLVCSSFGGAAAMRLEVAENKGCEVSNEKTLKKKFTESDIIFLSGHHYATENAPLLFNKDSPKEWDLKKMKITANRVKLLMISSCAGLYPNALHLFRKKFPNAYIFGWLSKSPDPQNGMMREFIKNIDVNFNINTQNGMEQLIQEWRTYVEGLEMDKLKRKIGYAKPNGVVITYGYRNKKWGWKTKKKR